MIVPQMPAANAASSATKRRTASRRCGMDSVLRVAFPVERPVVRVVGSQIVAREDPFAAASLAREVGRGLRRRTEADDQDADADHAAETAEQPLAWNVEHVGDAGADVVRGG